MLANVSPEPATTARCWFLASTSGLVFWSAGEVGVEGGVEVNVVDVDVVE